MGLLMDRNKALKAATILLEYVGSLDPTFAERIQITKDEFHYDDLQTAGAYIADQLEAGRHTVIPRHPFFEPGFTPPPAEGVVCPICKNKFDPAYPGQALCGNICAAAFYKARG